METDLEMPNLTIGQRAAQAVRQGAPIKDFSKVSKEFGIGETAVRIVEKVFRLNPPVFEAIEHGKISINRCYKILRLPEEERASALDAAIVKSYDNSHNSKKKAVKSPKSNRRNYKEEWKALRPAVHARIYEKSIFPEDAPIPRGDTPDEKFVRNAIEQLHKNEANLPDYSKTQLDDLIYPYTQAIQTYIINRDKRPRPEGELDPRFWDWARHAAARMLSLQNFYNYRYTERKKKEAEAETKRVEPRIALSIFDRNFQELWRTGVPFLREFPLSDLEKLKARWITTVDRYFQTRTHRASRTPKLQTDTLE